MLREAWKPRSAIHWIKSEELLCRAALPSPGIPHWRWSRKWGAIAGTQHCLGFWVLRSIVPCRPISAQHLPGLQSPLGAAEQPGDVSAVPPPFFPGLVVGGPRRADVMLRMGQGRLPSPLLQRLQELLWTRAGWAGAPPFLHPRLAHPPSAWWILFFLILSWVLWGILPKVSASPSYMSWNKQKKSEYYL